MSRTRKNPGSDWRDGFLFLGNHLALDFLNTRPAPEGRPVELLPDLGGLLRWFQAANVISSREKASLQKKWGDSILARRTVERIRELREVLRAEISGWESGGALHRHMADQLNSLMADHPMLNRLRRNGASTAIELWFRPERPEDLFAPLAYCAAKLFAESEPSRVRQCGHCVLHFLDTSKKGTRRWCSMQLCGNRLKVGAYAARQRSRAEMD